MPTTIRLPQEAEDRLDALAAKTGRSKSYYLRQFILQGLEDTEDYYLAHEAYERYRSGEEPTRAWEEVREELGLDDPHPRNRRKKAQEAGQADGDTDSKLPVRARRRA
jgi:RHH-type rel operon transcriptional repressor/antitoxin RelB